MPARRSPDLVGRADDVARLSEALGLTPPTGTSAAPGSAPVRAILLAGDAGVGKTRLLAELRDRAVAAGWRVVIGHCLDLADGTVPYLPFTEILGRLADEEPATVAAAIDRHPALARLQPGRRLMSAGEPGGPGPGEPRHLVDGVPSLLEDVARQGPLLVVVEDIHWADRATLDLLRVLLTRPFADRVALVASYRSDDLHRRHPLRREVAEWARIRDVERHQLGPLGGEDVRRLIQLLHPEPLSSGDVAAIVARAEGNAFFVEELVGAGLPGDALPDDLADLLLVRLDRLDADSREAVRAVAVAGRRVTHGALSAATGLEPAGLEAAVREAVDRQVLEPVGGDSYAFRHALLAEAVYDDLLPGERARWHAAYAEALQAGRCHGTAAELARHARLAGDEATALRAGVQAGDDALSVGAPDEAAQHYLQALTLVSRGAELAVGDLAELAAKAADALFAAGHSGRSVRVAGDQLDRLPADAAPADRARLVTALAQGLSVIDTDDDAAARSAEAVSLLADGPPRQRASALALHARLLGQRGRLAEARQAGVEALALADRHALPRLATDVMTTFAQLDTDRTDEEIRHALEDAVDQAGAAGARAAELRARYYLGRFGSPGPRPRRRGRRGVRRRPRRVENGTRGRRTPSSHGCSAR
ncbi:MAG: AAA family ATPase [Nocardioides sp.]